jgi:hypothetical protein
MHREAVEIAMQLAELGEGRQCVDMLDRLSRINLLLAQSGLPELTVPLSYAEKVTAKLSAGAAGRVLSLKSDCGE